MQKGGGTGCKSEGIDLPFWSFRTLSFVKDSGAYVTLSLPASFVLEMDRREQVGHIEKQWAYARLHQCCSSLDFFSVALMSSDSGYPASDGKFFFNGSIVDLQCC